MTTLPHQSPIERFLGPEALRAGPFGLLRLTPETCTDERIVASLEWQLDRVAQHPEGDTPEADEVRLALHAAAAQLLDPNVRRHVLQSMQQRGDSTPVAAARPPGSTPGGRLTGLEEDALRALAAYGGWNRQSLERLKNLAYVRGMGSHEVALTLQNLATEKGRPPAVQGKRDIGVPQQTSTRHAPSEESQDRPTTFVDPGAKYLRNVLIAITGVVVFLMVVVVVAAVLMTSGPSKSTANGTPHAAAPPGKTETAEPSAAAPPGQRNAAAPSKGATPADKAKPATAAPETVVDPQALVRALAECAAAARREPDAAAERFVPLIRSLASRWCKLDQSQRRSADASVLNMVLATDGYPEVSARVIECVSDGARRLAGTATLLPEDTWPAVWSVGILTRLSRETELPHAVSNAIDTALTAAVGQDRPRTGATFESGAMAAIRRLPERLLPAANGETTPPSTRKPDEYIRPWIDAVSTIAGSDPELKERLLVDALQRILTVSGEPNTDQRVFDAVQTLVTEIKWRRGGAARARLLDWFRDPRVSMQDLQVVTGALASKSSAEGVDAMMVLSVGAAPADRQRLRTAYAKAWGIAESVGEDKASADWLRGTKEELSRTTEGLRPAELLVMAVTLTRLNEAATRLWRGESEKVAEIVEQAVELPNNNVVKVTVPVRKVLTQNIDGDGQWTASYLSLGRNVALRQEKLTQMEKYTVNVGPVDAEELVTLACFESPVDLRATAQRAVAKLANEATIVNAALEILPRAPKYASVATMFEQIAHRRLPRPAETGWELEARRALVARLLELLAAAGEDARIDDLSRIIFEAYAVRAGSIGLEESDATAESGAAKGARAAADLLRAWRADAEAVAPNEHAPVPLDAIDRRHQGRLRLAQGPVQSFAAEQVTAAELMAYVVSAEHPRLATQVKEVVDEMATARRQSRHIFEQMMHAERAMLRLWRLRIAGDQP